MNDQQLKIRIKLNQIPQALESENPEETTDQAALPFEKRPFDWRKISIAAWVLATILFGAFYWWLAEENTRFEPDSVPKESTHFQKDDGLIHDKNAGSGSVVENENTAPDITPTHSAEIHPAIKPAVSAIKPAPKPDNGATSPSHNIIPLKKPETTD